MANLHTQALKNLVLIILFICYGLTQHAFGQAQDSLTIKDIYITGNKLTRASVIFREISIKKGERLSRQELTDRMRESEKFLINQSLYLDVYLRDSVANGDAYIYIKVKERFNIDFWHPQVKVADRNFNEWLRSPSVYRLTYGLPVVISSLRGDNDKLTLSAIFGWRQTFGIDYRVPYLNKEKTLGIENIFTYQDGHEVGAITSDNQLQYVRVDQQVIFQKISYETDFIYRKKYQVTHTFTIGFDYYKIGDTVSRINPDYLGNGRTIIRVPRLAYKFIYDKRDYAVYARKGDYLNFSIEHDGLPVLLKDVNVTTIDFTYRKFVPMGGRFYYDGGITTENELQTQLPYVFRSSLGYRYQVRGFEHYLSDGNAYILAENEIKFLLLSRSFKLPLIRVGAFNPVPLAIYPKVFYDEGVVFYQNPDISNNLVNKLMSGWGAGIDLTTYYDFVMRVEYSFNNLGEGGWFLHFTEVF